MFDNSLNFAVFARKNHHIMSYALLSQNLILFKRVGPILKKKTPQDCSLFECMEHVWDKKVLEAFKPETCVGSIVIVL